MQARREVDALDDVRRVEDGMEKTKGPVSRQSTEPRESSSVER